MGWFSGNNRNIMCKALMMQGVRTSAPWFYENSGLLENLTKVI